MIVEESKDNKKMFKEISSGDCFMWYDNIYIKMGSETSAVNLRTGGEVDFDNNEKVLPLLNAKVVV